MVASGLGDALVTSGRGLRFVSAPPSGRGVAFVWAWVSISLGERAEFIVKTIASNPFLENAGLLFYVCV